MTVQPTRVTCTRRAPRPRMSRRFARVKRLSDDGPCLDLAGGLDQGVVRAYVGWVVAGYSDRDTDVR